MKKTKLSIALVLFNITLLMAATLTVEIPTNDVPRVSEAFGNLPFTGPDGQPTILGRPATINEVAYIVRTNYLITRTQDWEKQKARAAYSAPPLEMQPTPTATPTATATFTPTPTPTASPSGTPTP
jgi:hypothetical protein